MLKENIDYRFDSDKGLLFVSYGGEWTPIKLEGYQFLSIIAPGANGVTVKAHHKVTDRYVVIKVWKPRRNDLEQYREQFYKEVQKISRIKHQNIVTIHDGRVLDCGFCLAVLDFIEGIPLKNWLNQEHSKQEKIDVCKKILMTVLAYQKQEIIHGDLHTGNILISHNNDIHIIDFGTSLFSKENQSRERECYFAEDLTRFLLKEFSVYCDKHFAFTSNINKKCLEKKKSPLLRFNFEPLLITETLVEYVNIVELLTYVSSLSMEDIVTLCSFASRTRYIDIIEFMNDIMNRYIERDLHESFIAIMDENIDEDTFPAMQENYTYAKMTYQASIFAYYELSKSIRPILKNPIGKKIIVHSKKKQLEEICFYDLLIIELNKCIEADKSNTYFDICLEVASALECSLFSIQNDIREILYYSLQENTKNVLKLHYWINTRIHEILCDKVLYQEIQNLIDIHLS